MESDLPGIANGIARDSLIAARRFLEAVEETLTGLRRTPGKGSPGRLRGALSEVRSWAVRGFPNHLIFYEVRPREIYVFAVLHGSRKYQCLLRQRL